jgi:host factor-I protein
MGKSINLQDMFLNQVRKEGIVVTIFLTGGHQLKGTVKGFDQPGRATQLVYKHAVASIVPAREIGSRDEERAPRDED